MFTTAVLLFAAIPLLYAGDGVVQAFDFVSTMCATLILFTWGSIVVSYIVYRRRDPEKHAASKFRVPFAGAAPYLVLAFFAFIVFALLYSEGTRMATLATPVWFVLLAVLWQLRKRQLVKAGLPLTGQIPTIAHPLDREED